MCSKSTHLGAFLLFLFTLSLVSALFLKFLFSITLKICRKLVKRNTVGEDDGSLQHKHLAKHCPRKLQWKDLVAWNVRMTLSFAVSVFTTFVVYFTCWLHLTIIQNSLPIRQPCPSNFVKYFLSNCFFHFDPFHLTYMWRTRLLTNV